jgi:hypothetical protein
MPIRLQADADLDHDILRGVCRRHPELDFRKPQTQDSPVCTILMSYASAH